MGGRVRYTKRTKLGQCTLGTCDADLKTKIRISSYYFEVTFNI